MDQIFIKKRISSKFLLKTNLSILNISELQQPLRFILKALVSNPLGEYLHKNGKDSSQFNTVLFPPYGVSIKTYKSISACNHYQTKNKHSELQRHVKF